MPGDTRDGHEAGRDVTGSSSTLGGPLPSHLVIEAEIGKTVKINLCVRACNRCTEIWAGFFFLPNSIILQTEDSSESL